MRKKVISIIIPYLFLFLPFAVFAVEPVSFVITKYQENYTILDDGKADVVLTISTEMPLEKQLIIPIAIDNIQNTTIQTPDKNIQVLLITIDNLVYISIIPDSLKIVENNTITINLSINDFITEDGFLFRKKSALIPLISNYPNNNKSNIFIDTYDAVVTIPTNYKLDKNDLKNAGADFKIDLNENNRVLKISADYQNLHSIKHESVLLSESFNPIILLGLIIGLLLLYFVYFSSLIKYEEPVQDVALRY